jgi:hypothetical protein
LEEIVEKKSKKKPIILVVSLLVLTVIGVFVVYGQMYTNKAEEIWSFRESVLDQEFFPLRSEVVACIFDYDERDEYECNRTDIDNRIEESKSTLSNYEVKYDDTKSLKIEVMEGLSLLEDVLEENHKISKLDSDDSSIVELTENLYNKGDELGENTKDINEIVNEYYQ